MAAKLGQKKKGQKVKKPVQPVNDIEKDSNVVLTKTPEEVNVKRDKAKATEKKNTGFFAFCRKFDPIAFTCFIAIILAGVVILGAYVNATYINPEWDSPTAVDGDTVKVRYVGSYGGYYYEEGAVIFDTNVESVNDGAEYLKSPSYTNKTKFDLLEFEVGGDDVLEMFGDAVIGKLINWTAVVKISPENGYGESTKHNYDGKFTMNTVGTMSLEAFNEYASTNYKASDFATSSVIVDMPIGLEAEVNLTTGTSDVVYRYVNVVKDETGDTRIDSNVSYKITDVATDGKSFGIEYSLKEGRMFKAVNCEGGSEQIIYIDNFNATKTWEWKVGAVDNAGQEEQKGEDLYFWIEIVDINGYAGA